MVVREVLLIEVVKKMQTVIPVCQMLFLNVHVLVDREQMKRGSNLEMEKLLRAQDIAWEILLHQRGQAVRPDVMGRRNVTRNLTFYANGFQVDDGPLRSFDDPENDAFLSDVNRSVVSREMEEAGIGDVSITLIDKKTAEYVEPKNKVVPFSGGGQRLSDAPPAQVHNSGGRVDAEGAAAAVRVDESRPIATNQVRLNGGTRVMARLNEDSTVGELRRFVAASRPGVQSFTLSTTYPRKVLENDDETIKEAKTKRSRCFANT